MELKNIPIEKIMVDIEQPRKTFKGIKELARNIKEQGMIKPLEVEKINDGNYLLIDGERRFKAIQHLKLEEKFKKTQQSNWKNIPCIVKDKIKDKLLTQLSIDFHKNKLNPVEQGEAIKKLIEQGYIKSDITKLLGVSNSFMNDRLKILEFNDNTKRLIRNGDIKTSVYQRLFDCIKSDCEDKIVKRIIEEKAQTEEEIKGIIREEQEVKFIINDFLSGVYSFGRRCEDFRKKLPHIKKDILRGRDIDIRNNFNFTIEEINNILNEIEQLDRIKEGLIKSKERLENGEKNLSEL